MEGIFCLASAVKLELRFAADTWVCAGKVSDLSRLMKLAEPGGDTWLREWECEMLSFSQVSMGKRIMPGRPPDKASRISLHRKFCSDSTAGVLPTGPLQRVLEAQGFTECRVHGLAFRNMKPWGLRCQRGPRNVLGPWRQTGGVPSVPEAAQPRQHVVPVSLQAVRKQEPGNLSSWPWSLGFQSAGTCSVAWTRT